jgi:hypothetical protein
VERPMLRPGHAGLVQAREYAHLSERQNRNVRCIEVTARCG